MVGALVDVLQSDDVLVLYPAGQKDKQLSTSPADFFFFPGFSFSFSGPNASLSTHKETCLASCCCCSDPTHTHSHSAALICACAVENQADDVCVHGRNEELLYVCVFVRACVFETERGGGGGGGGGGMGGWRILGGC